MIVGSSYPRPLSCDGVLLPTCKSAYAQTADALDGYAVKHLNRYEAEKFTVWLEANANSRIVRNHTIVAAADIESFKLALMGIYA